jgi:carbamoyl-phosphate synthase small subunit
MASPNISRANKYRSSSSCLLAHPPHFFPVNQISGLIISDYSSEYSHWNAVQSLGQWLTSAGQLESRCLTLNQPLGIPALYGIDTRRLTKKIRVHGSLLGKIQFPDQHIQMVDPNQTNLVARVSTPVSYTLGPEDATIKIIAFDCGMKLNIVRSFLQHDVSPSCSSISNPPSLHRESASRWFPSTIPSNPIQRRSTMMESSSPMVLATPLCAPTPSSLFGSVLSPLLRPDHRAVGD